jgi:hypothetical protein
VGSALLDGIHTFTESLSGSGAPAQSADRDEEKPS